MISKYDMEAAVSRGIQHAIDDGLITVSETTSEQVVASRIIGRIWQLLNANGVFSKEQHLAAGYTPLYTYCG